MKNITMQEITDYTNFASGRVEITGNKRTEPFLTLPEDLGDNPDTVERWIAYLSSFYKRTKSDEAKELLLNLENMDAIGGEKFEKLDDMISEEIKLH